MALTAQPCSFLPPHLLRHLAQTRPEVSARVEATLVVDDRIRLRRREAPPGAPTAAFAARDAWTVHDAGGGTELPGRPVRSAGDGPSGDAAVDEAAAGIETGLAMLAEVFERRSYDGAGGPVSATVHYGENYVNAFWDGVQLVFGDGDGEVFGRFTAALDVVVHELSHAVVQHTADLVYADQPGALNESVCDVLAACADQRARGQGAGEADWLIGRDLFLPGVSARALRDMAAPGTAYDDPVLGADPQVGHMDDYVVTDDDNGGVHLNSGIPNRAFQLAATAIGGPTWEGAGRIWYAALTGPVGPRTDFAGFAAATVGVAGAHADAVREAWTRVGVTPGGDGRVDAPPPRAGDGRTLRVRRSGGLTGRTEVGEIDLDAGDRRCAEARSLLDRVDLATVGARAAEGPATADGFVFRFEPPDAPPVAVPERALTDDLRRLVGLVLRR